MCMGRGTFRQVFLRNDAEIRRHSSLRWFADAVLGVEGVFRCFGPAEITQFENLKGRKSSGGAYQLRPGVVRRILLNSRAAGTGSSSGPRMMRSACMCQTTCSSN